MDPGAVDVSRLTEYGIAGTVAALLLTVVVVAFRQLVAHALKQNDELMARQHEMEMKLLESMHAVGQTLRDLANEIRHLKVEVSRDVAGMVREEVTEAGSRAHRPRKT